MPKTSRLFGYALKNDRFLMFCILPGVPRGDCSAIATAPRLPLLHAAAASERRQLWSSGSLGARFSIRKQSPGVTVPVTHPDGRQKTF